MTYADIGKTGVEGLGINRLRVKQKFDPTGMEGLGNASTVINAGGAIGQSALGTAMATGAIGGPMGIAIAAGITGLVIGLQQIFNKKGGKQKEAATKIAEDAWRLMEDNLESFQASHKTADDKAIALQRFDELFSIMNQAFSHPELGEHGKRAIRERARGGIYDSTAAYRDPIAASDVTPMSEAWANYLGISGSSFGGNATGGMSLLLWGGLGLIVLAVVMEEM